MLVDMLFIHLAQAFVVDAISKTGRIQTTNHYLIIADER